MSTELVQTVITEEIVVERVNPEIILATEMVQGVAGAPGIPGAGGEFIGKSLIAAIDLGGHRAVVSSATGLVYASNLTPSHAGLMMGITSAAVTAGNLTQVVFAGELENSGWSWDLTKGIWLSDNGLLTQTMPVTGFVMCLGVPISVTSMNVRPGVSIIL